MENIMRKRKITAEDLLKIKFIRTVALSPDRSRVMFTVEEVSSDKKKYFSHICMIGIDGGNFRQYTFGEVSDSGPVFSPDGNWIIFASKRGEKKGVYKMAVEGGEPMTLIETDGSYSDISISPDSKKILCVFKKADDLPKDKDGKKEEPVYRHITRMAYKLDNAGFLPQDPGNIYIFDIESGKGKKLTNHKNGTRGPVWFPNGKRIAYIANVHPNPDEESLRDDIFVISSDGGKARKLNKPAGPVGALSVSPDGEAIAFAGHAEPNDAWGVANEHVWVAPLGGKAVDLMPNFDSMANDVTITDQSESTELLKPAWSPDGREIYFIYSDSGSTLLGKVSSNGGKVKTVVDGKLHIMGAAMSSDTRLAVLLLSTVTAPAEIYIYDTIGKGKPRKLTHLNDKLTRELEIPKPEELIVRGADGYPIHSWILKPPGFSPKRKYPSIMQIHGGPRTQYGNTFFHEMQYLAAKGYVVYYSNPRGGQGYGRAHAASIVNAWGTVDYDDCMALADYMEQQSYIDPKKMGVTGGSYGGYMTNWIVGHTDRFAAAVTQRSVTNFISFYGSSDFGFAVDREIQGRPWTDVETWWEMSPVKHVASIKTPLLITHGEQDLRCAIEQAEQLFISLKKLGRKVEMIRFPEEPHGLSRCGRPDRRIARLEWIGKWFDRYLKA